jgi:ABC-2 type transport system permease protein
LRWRLFLNSLRSRKRQAEMAVQGISYFLGGMFVFSSSAGLGAATFFVLRNGKPRILDLMLWAVFFFWQLVPLLFEGYSPGLNFSEVARYPVSFRLYFLLNAAYGLFDPAAMTGLLWLLSIWLGILLARPEWALPAAIYFLVFAVLNILCNRLIIGLLERFQSTRRGRERVAAVLLILMIIPQIFNFAVQGWIGVRRFHLPAWTQELAAQVDRFSPPGLITQSLMSVDWRDLLFAALLLAYTLLAGWLLWRRLRAVYQGEIYAETFKVHRELKVKPGWRLPGLDEKFSAILEKEIRYLRQNPRLLVMLANPVILFMLIAVGPARKVMSLAHPAGLLAGFAGLLALSVTNLSGNTFGMDGSGFGRWLLSPLPLRKVLLGKSLTQGAILTALYLAGATVVLGAGKISGTMFLAITAGFLGILIILLGAGNVISVYWPKRIEPTQMSSRLVSQAAGLATMLITVALAAPAGLVVLAAWYWNLAWLPLVAGLLALAASLQVYSWLLNWATRHANDHLEELASTLGV